MWFSLPAPPSITHLWFTYGPTSSNLTCISTGSPATNVIWMRDGQPLILNGSTYQLTQTVADRRLSTYKNVLIINRATSDIIGNTYNCTIINALGKVSRTLVACKCTVPCECRNPGLPETHNYCIEVCICQRI